MQNFQETFETPKLLLISAFSICMTVPLNNMAKNLIITNYGTFTTN